MTRVAFERADDPNLINFAVGQPDQALIPIDALKQASAHVGATLSSGSVNYGVPQGEPQFLEPLAQFISANSHHPVTAEELMLTGGASQALDMICQAFTSPGDTVLIEDASYFLAFQIFADHGLELVTFSRSAGTIDTQALGQLIEAHQPKLLYTIPFFSNPLGDSLSTEAIASLISLCSKSGTLLVSDEAYQYLGFDHQVESSLASRAADAKILSLGTFSKILAPGLRVGWIQCRAPLRERLLDLGWVNSGGAINQWGSILVGAILEAGRQPSLLETTRTILQTRARVMHACLTQHLGSIATWVAPRGGYFVWVTLKEAANTTALLPRVREQGVGYQPGASFSSTGAHAQSMRLSFAAYDTHKIEQGINLLGTTLKGLIE